VELGKASKNVTSLNPASPAPIKADHKVPSSRDRAPAANIVVNLAAQKVNKGANSKLTRSTPSRGFRPAKTQSEIIAERRRQKEKGALSDNSETSSESSASFSVGYKVSTSPLPAVHAITLHLPPPSLLFPFTDSPL
jgi:hypothetical protein